MRNLSDQGFDRELRNYLDNSDIPFDPSAWDKMNRKLDLFFNVSGKMRDGLLGLLSLSLLLSSVFFWGLNTFSQSELAIGINNPDHQQITGHTLQKDDNSKILSQENHTSKDESFGHQGIDPKKQTANPSASISSQPLNPEPGKTEKPQAGENIVQESNPKALPSRDPDKIPQQNLAVTTAGALNTTEKLNRSKTDEIEDEGLGVSDAIDELTATSAAINMVTPRNVDQDLTTETDLPKTLHHTRPVADMAPPVISSSSSPWSLGIGYAPDISLVGFSEATSPGTNLSLMVEYRLSQHWSLQTAFTYSTKKYKASGEDYHPPYGFWGYGSAPESAEATCEVIDIPINIRYYFSSLKKHRFYVSTGLSTYLMLTEDYHYHYQDYTSPDQPDSYSVSNENQHLFGIYNLSVGYQRTIGGHLFFEIEPFLKAPLSGVGFGDVNLWSTGSYFSLKYNF